MNSLFPKTPETIYYTAVQPNYWKAIFQDGRRRPFWIFANYDLCPHFWERHPLQFYSLTFKEDKNTKKRTFALHGHGSAPDDPTTARVTPYVGRDVVTCCCQCRWKACQTDLQPHGLLVSCWNKRQMHRPQTNIPYQLRNRSHNITLINKTKFLNDTDFIIRQMHKSQSAYYAGNDNDT